MTRMLKDPRQLKILEWLSGSPNRAWRAKMIARHCERVHVPSSVDGHEYSQLLRDLREKGLVEKKNHTHKGKWGITEKGLEYLEKISSDQVQKAKAGVIS